MITFLPLGGGNEIGANCYYINVNGNGIILDCGIHPKKTGLESLPRFDLIADKPVDYALITHAHQDHIGALPFLVKKHPYVKIISTPQTRAIAELTLHNAVSILKKEINDERFEFYDHDEVDLLIQMINYREYNNSFLLQSFHHNNDANVNCTFYDAGHILGSAGILLEAENHKIFYTGDIILTAQSILSGAQLPATNVDTLIIESTYGATDSQKILPWKDEQARFANEINKVIHSGGSILVPVFALGKMQEMLATVWNLIERRKIPEVDIYTSGVGRKINRVYDYNRYVVNRIDKEFELLSIPQKDYNEINNPEDLFKDPCIVLASSGMIIEGTTSYNFAKHWLQKNNSAIFFVGYLDKDAQGYAISTAQKGDKINFGSADKTTKVQCGIINFKFSAHSRREDLLQIVKLLNPNNVLIVHGEPSAVNWLGAEIIKFSSKTKVYSSEPGKEIIL